MFKIIINLLPMFAGVANFIFGALTHNSFSIEIAIGCLLLQINLELMAIHLEVSK